DQVMVSDLLEAMREMCSLDAIHALDDEAHRAELALSTSRAAELHRIAATRFLRTAYETMQTAINTTNSDLYAATSELSDLQHGDSSANVRAATATRSTLARTLTRLRSVRTRFYAAIDRWRRGAAPDAVAITANGGLDADDLAALEHDLG